MEEDAGTPPPTLEGVVPPNAAINTVTPIGNPPEVSLE